MDLSRIKPGVEVVNSLIATLAIVVGAVWALREFVWKREAFPQMEISQAIYSTFVSPNERLVRVTVTLENKGSGIVRPHQAEAELRQVTPWPQKFGPTRWSYIQSDWDWPLLVTSTQDLSDVEIEPNEKDQFNFDFVVDPSIKVLLITSWVNNPSKQNGVGWVQATLYEIPKDQQVNKIAAQPDQRNKPDVRLLK